MKIKHAILLVIILLGIFYSINDRIECSQLKKNGKTVKGIITGISTPSYKNSVGKVYYQYLAGSSLIESHIATDRREVLGNVVIAQQCHVVYDSTYPSNSLPLLSKEDYVDFNLVHIDTLKKKERQ